MITKLSSEIAQQNTQVPGLTQFDMHLFGSYHLAERTEIQQNITDQLHEKEPLCKISDYPNMGGGKNKVLAAPNVTYGNIISLVICLPS